MSRLKTARLWNNGDILLGQKDVSADCQAINYGGGIFVQVGHGSDHAGHYMVFRQIERLHVIDNLDPVPKRRKSR